MIKIPGRSYAGPLPSLTVEQISIREELVYDVDKLASEIGERNIWPYQNLVAAADFIEASLTDRGYKINRQNFSVEGKTCSNIETEISGTKGIKEIVVIGAHYDNVFDSPGADDNGSGVAAVLALARRFASQRPTRTLRFVLFANEEPPFFQTKDMGSLIYAKKLQDKKR